MCVGLIMEASEALSEKILEERQIEKWLSATKQIYLENKHVKWKLG